MMTRRAFSLLVAAGISTLLLVACGGQNEAADPLDSVAASPVVRQAWAGQKERLAGPSPEAPREDEVRLSFALRNDLYDPARRDEARVRFYEVWENDPQNPLWVEIARVRKRHLEQPTRFARLLEAAAGSDTTATAHHFVHGLFAWSDRPRALAGMQRAAAVPGGNDLLDFWVQLRLSRFEFENGSTDDAIERIVGLLPDAWSLGGAPLAGIVWLDLGRIVRTSHRLGDALLAARAGDACARHARCGYLRTRAELAAGRAHLARGEAAAALEAFGSCQTIARDSSYHRLIKYAVLDAARAARLLGDEELEKERLLSGHDLVTLLADTNTMIRSRAVLASVERRLGNWDAAEEWFKAADDADAAWSGRSLRYLIDEERAILRSQQGRYAEAESLRMANSSAGGDGSSSLSLLASRINLVRQALETDRPPLAYWALAEARSLDPENLLRTAEYDPVLQLEIVAARLHARQGEHHLADQALQRARTRRDDASPDASWFLAEAEGLVAQAAGDTESARSAYENCHQLAAGLDNPDRVRRSRVLLGSMLLKSGFSTQAESLFAVDLNSPEYWPRLNSRLLTGMSRSQAGHPHSALAAFTSAESLLGADAPRDLLARLRLEQGRALVQLSRPAEAFERLEEARRADLARSGAGPTEADHSFFTRVNREVAEATLALLRRDPDLMASSDPIETTRQLAAWGRGEAPAATVTRSRTRLEFFVGADHAFAWVLPADDAPATWLELESVSRLRELVEEVTVDMSYPGRPIHQEGADELGRLLYDPVRAAWAEGTVLEILPDDVLTSLPWAALRMAGAEARVALEFGPLVVVHPGDGPADRHEEPKGLLVLGTNGSAEGGSDRQLNRAEDEARAVAQLWPDLVDLRVGSDARWPELRTGGARGYRTIHIASHTRVYEGADGHSTIHIAGLDDAAPLVLSEIPDLGADADLIYLSSCEGGRRHRAAGHGVTSFAESFLAAGAGAVVASTVAVDDEAAAALAQAFYRHWLNNEERAAALRAALLEVRDGNPDWRHPFYWGFTHLHQQSP